MSEVLWWLGGFFCGLSAGWGLGWRHWQERHRALLDEYRLLQWELVQAHKELSRRRRVSVPPAWFPVEERER